MILDLVYVPLFVLLAVRFPKLLLTPWEQHYYPAFVRIIIFHFAVGVGYYFFTRNGGGDAWGYWTQALEMDHTQFLQGLFDGEGTKFMWSFNYLFVNTLNLSFFANTMLYSMFGAVGISFFLVVALRTIPYNKLINGYVLFPLIFFLPNLHFWSSGVGKDSILFLCIAMFVYGLMKPFRRMPLLVLAGLLSMAIRPHITLFLLIGFGLAYIFGGKISGFQRLFFSAILIGVGVAILPSVLQFAKIDEASAEAFSDFAESKSAVLSRSSTGSAVDISSYPLPLKVLTFWFRPFFFDVRNINGLIASIENLILLIIFIKAMRSKPVAAFRAAPFIIKGLVLFLIVGTLAFSQSLGNVGIMIRMRNMFLPGMLIYILWVFSYDQQRRLLQIRALKRPNP